MLQTKDMEKVETLFKFNNFFSFENRATYE